MPMMKLFCQVANSASISYGNIDAIGENSLDDVERRWDLR